VNLDRTHPMANSIKEHIKERLEVLWDVEEVKVVFNQET